MEHKPVEFETPYKSLVDGTWAKQWQAAQAPYLPPHRINHATSKLQCTCGKGPFRSMKEWSNHALRQGWKEHNLPTATRKTIKLWRNFHLDDNPKV